MITSQQCRAARAWLNWSQEALAKEARVALSTVRDFERGDREPIAHNIEAIQRALEFGGIRFESGAHEWSGIKYDPRIREEDTYMPILKILYESPGGFMKTSDLIVSLEAAMEPQGEDAAILENRNDTKFSQIVRNVISHRTTSTNLIGKGYAEYDKSKRGLRITKAGSDALVEAEKAGKTVL